MRQRAKMRAIMETNEVEESFDSGVESVDEDDHSKGFIKRGRDIDDVDLAQQVNIKVDLMLEAVGQDFYHISPNRPAGECACDALKWRLSSRITYTHGR